MRGVFITNMRIALAYVLFLEQEIMIQQNYVKPFFTISTQKTGVMNRLKGGSRIFSRAGADFQNYIEGGRPAHSVVKISKNSVSLFLPARDTQTKNCSPKNFYGLVLRVTETSLTLRRIKPRNKLPNGYCTHQT